MIGQQPWLGEGEQFSYTSGAVLTTPVGTMQGSYEFRTDGDEYFDVPIDVFSLESIVWFINNRGRIRCW